MELGFDWDFSDWPIYGGRIGGLVVCGGICSALGAFFGIIWFRVDT